MAQFRTRIHDLRIGMTVGRDVYADNGVIIVPEGTEVNHEVISLLKRHFIEYIDVFVEDSIPQVPEPPEKKRIREFHEFKEKFEIAKEDIANNLVNIVFRDENINVEALLSSLNEVIETADNNLALCDMLYYMKETSKGIYTHSINVAVLGQLLGRWMKMEEHDIDLIGLSGLLHDIGKLKLPHGILNKREALTGEEILEFEKHPVYGYNSIKNKEIDSRVKQAVLTHHENLNGSGYPFQVEAKSITMYSRILSIADNYDLLTSKQPDREAKNPFEVVHIFEEDGFDKYDASLLMTFLSNILNNFIQYRVLLSNGAEGEIVFINKSNLSRPLIKTESGFLDLAVKKDVNIVRLLTGVEAAF